MKRLPPKALLLVGSLAFAFAVAPVALSFVPSGARIAKATARENREALRTQALRIALSLRVAEREPIATGSLVIHPSGLARLELRDGSGRVERHLLVGTEHTASSEGEELDTPRSFLPPLFLLQASSEQALEQALLDFGMDALAVALAPCLSRVCFVVGDPSRVAPVPAESEGSGEESAPDDLEMGSPGDREEELPDLAHAWPTATLWIDAETFEIVRIESRAGVVTELGPYVAWGEVRLPNSITIEEPGREPVHLEFETVTPVNAPAAEFGRAWLLGPTPSPPDESSLSPAEPAPR